MHPEDKEACLKILLLYAAVLMLCVWLVSIS